MTMSLVNWNVEWATPRSKRTPEIHKRLDEHSPDVVCLTETHTEVLPQSEYLICSRPDAGYKVREYRRKVVLWSRAPWEHIDGQGHESMLPGRYVSGVTQTPIGEVTVIRVCIPWSLSRTEGRRGPEQKRHWEDHETYLEDLSELLKGARDRPLIVTGDFNQKIGQRGSAPRKLRSALQDTMPEHLFIASKSIPFSGAPYPAKLSSPRQSYPTAAPDAPAVYRIDLDSPGNLSRRAGSRIPQGRVS